MTVFEQAVCTIFDKLEVMRVKLGPTLERA
jgi:hypothetical protein